MSFLEVHLIKIQLPILIIWEHTLQVYSPLKHYGLDKPGMKVGVLGLGGLGHMCAADLFLSLLHLLHLLLPLSSVVLKIALDAGRRAVKIGKAMGLEITVLSTSEKKREEATSRLGADHFVVSKDADQMAAVAGTLDGIIDTVSAQHSLPDYLGLLKLVRGCVYNF